jgi:malonate transporter and related proteins
MLEIFHVTTPFFALILCGYLAANFRLLPENAVPALNTFVLYFALPCMLVRFTSQTPFAELANLRVFLAYGLASLAMLGLFVGVARIAAREPMRDAAYGGLAASWSNWGYMGFALLPPMLGPASLPILVAAGMADLLVLVSVAIALASLEGAQGSVRAALAGAARGIARSPLVWSIAAGGALSALELPLPQAPAQLLKLLGDAAVPVALFTIGVSLYRPGTRGGRTEVLVITGAKLIAHPYLAALVAAYLFHLPPLEVRTLALAAALPVAGTVFLLAERAGANGERIAAAILVSTALAFFSFAGLCWAFGVSPAR